MSEKINSKVMKLGELRVSVPVLDSQKLISVLVGKSLEENYTVAVVVQGIIHNIRVKIRFVEPGNVSVTYFDTKTWQLLEDE